MSKEKTVKLTEDEIDTIEDGLNTHLNDLGEIVMSQSGMSHEELIEANEEKIRQHLPTERLVQRALYYQETYVLLKKFIEL